MKQIIKQMKLRFKWLKPEFMYYLFYPDDKRKFIRVISKCVMRSE